MSYPIDSNQVAYQKMSFVLSAIFSALKCELHTSNGYYHGKKHCKWSCSKVWYSNRFSVWHINSMGNWSENLEFWMSLDIMLEDWKILFQPLRVGIASERKWCNSN